MSLVLGVICEFATAQLQLVEVTLALRLNGGVSTLSNNLPSGTHIKNPGQSLEAHQIINRPFPLHSPHRSVHNEISEGKFMSRLSLEASARSSIFMRKITSLGLSRESSYCIQPTPKAWLPRNASSQHLQATKPRRGTSYASLQKSTPSSLFQVEKGSARATAGCIAGLLMASQRGK